MDVIDLLRDQASYTVIGVIVQISIIQMIVTIFIVVLNRSQVKVTSLT